MAICNKYKTTAKEIQRRIRDIQSKIYNYKKEIALNNIQLKALKKEIEKHKIRRPKKIKSK